MAQESSYKDLLSNLAPRQKVVLQAIAKEGLAQNITSSKFIKKYSLSSASSVQAAVKLLLKNNLITQTYTGYRVYDFFLSEWLATVY
jgi:RIO-like serine/threonine protein kinase